MKNTSLSVAFLALALAAWSLSRPKPEPPSQEWSKEASLARYGAQLTYWHNEQNKLLRLQFEAAAHDYERREMAKKHSRLNP